jgi:hypothetical protein
MAAPRGVWVAVLLIAIVEFLFLGRSFQTGCSDQDQQTQRSFSAPPLAITEQSTAQPQLQKNIMDDYFCAPWHENMDEWWTHHPEWDVTLENRTHLCFRRIIDAKTRYLLEAYDTQWNSDCSNTIVWAMFGSGWSADLAHVAEGLICAVADKQPFAVAFKRFPWWHYSALKVNGTNPTCPERDMSCYFLPMGKCTGNNTQINVNKPKTKYSDFVTGYFQREDIMVTKYITRPQQWLRKAVYDYNEAKAPKLEGTCTVIHVRRGDVVLHKRNSRRYFAVSDYVEKLPAERKSKNATILLLTDDANAIDEAKEFYPDINWKYYDRERFRGTSGGWENTAPSNSPKMEVIVILSTLQLVRQCDAFVHGNSGFSNSILQQMIADKAISTYKIDEGVEVRSPTNNASHILLQQRLEVLRLNKTRAST